jgi:DNA repair protein RadC
VDGRLRALARQERPRERLWALGPGALSAVELVALVLGQGRAGADVLTTAETVLAQGGGGDGVAALARRTPAELLALPGIGPARAAALAAAFELGRRAAHEGATRARVASPADAAAVVAPLVEGLRHEEFWVLCLDARHGLIARRRVGMGGPSSTPADPRAVFAEAVREGASGVIVAHNHPSGAVEPSRADRDLTRALAQAGAALGIALYDHVVVGAGAYYSFRAAGELAEE